eukprot:TRINITY_DN12444_c0_g1_i5.p1 TRINITY_DN12444_c0_g1~~TRINITY_DN12444_c0_g1_i5.p1  ORF type:complete len:297 (+),score=59.58 TRINITY_DN12444_c0_g1_i5:83-892(+)
MPISPETTELFAGEISTGRMCAAEVGSFHDDVSDIERLRCFMRGKVLQLLREQDDVFAAYLSGSNPRAFDADFGNAKVMLPLARDAEDSDNQRYDSVRTHQYQEEEEEKEEDEEEEEAEEQKQLKDESRFGEASCEGRAKDANTDAVSQVAVAVPITTSGSISSRQAAAPGSSVGSVVSENVTSVELGATDVLAQDTPVAPLVPSGALGEAGPLQVSLMASLEIPAASADVTSVSPGASAVIGGVLSHESLDDVFAEFCREVDCVQKTP